jgi:glycosyltransferase involved in cell wall biosynthesis
MACGTPVIASNLPGVRAVVSDGVDGLLARPASVADLQRKLEMLLADASLRSHMGQQGRLKVEEKYTWSKIGEQLERAYEEVLSKAR